MVYEVYRNLAKVTLSPRPRITTELYDLVHASLGMASEINEIIDAITTNDGNNYGEELGDCWWYIAVADDALNLEIGHREMVPVDQSRDESMPYITADDAFMRGYIYNMSKYANEVKRCFAYGNPVSELVKSNCKQYLIKSGRALVFMSWCWKLDIKNIWETNIKKLAGRYGDKYSDFAANNRDLKAENAIISQHIKK